MPLHRRAVLQAASGAAIGAGLAPALARPPRLPRVRPADPAWPGPAAWDSLANAVGGNLIRVRPLFAACEMAPESAACASMLTSIKNPYYIGDHPAGTQTSGWIDAWRSEASAFAVAARSTRDVVAAVNFARAFRLRLVIKGGGHSYLGGSNAPDLLLVWTRPMDGIRLHDAFIPRGCAGAMPPVPAVSVQTGARWIAAYNAVTTAAGRYVQGGGCATVGVAGLVLGNGFGSFSKAYGSAASSLLEAEIVTADGVVRIANPSSYPDLFWALKGGGNGSYGVVTRLTLHTHDLPEFFGGVRGSIKASSDSAFRKLIAEFNAFYASSLFNPHWGEQASFGNDNVLRLSLVFQDFTESQVNAVLQPFLNFVSASPTEFTITDPIRITGIPARHWWDPNYLATRLPQRIMHDPRPGAPPDNIWWAGNESEVGFFIHGYESAWLPASLLIEPDRTRFNDALFTASRHWPVMLHYNKGLAGASPEVIAAARQTAMNPAVGDAFCLAIIGNAGPPAYPGMPGPGPDLALARRNAATIKQSADVLRALVPGAGSYVSEAGFDDPDWQKHSFGENYPRLLAVKRRYDPEGLFTTHHGVGSEWWSQDGFTPA